MATATLVHVREYLRSSYRPDAEYVEGRIEKRSMGGIEHSALQRQLLLLLSKEAYLAQFTCYPELRVRTSPDHYRIPDLCVLAKNAPWEDIVETPPMLFIEVLSPDDTMSRTLVRVRDFLGMGVPEVWVFDPETHFVHVCTASAIRDRKDGSLVVPSTECEISVTDVFSVLHRGPNIYPH